MFDLSQERATRCNHLRTCLLANDGGKTKAFLVLLCLHISFGRFYQSKPFDFFQNLLLQPVAIQEVMPPPLFANEPSTFAEVQSKKLNLDILFYFQHKTQEKHLFVIGFSN